MLTKWTIRPDIQERMHQCRVPRMDILGPLEYWIDDANSHEPHEQIDANYQHGGGWRDFDQFGLKWKVLGSDIEIEPGHFAPRIQYPGDPAYRPIAWTRLRDRWVFLYDHAWVGVFVFDDEKHLWILEHLARID